MKTAAVSAVSLLIAALALACSPANVSAGPGDAGIDLAAIEQACADYTYDYCARLQSCSTTAVQVRYGSTGVCESVENALCLSVGMTPATGATPEQNEACGKALGDWSCTDFLVSQNPPPACQLVTGPLANGATCAVRSQCQSGYCGFPAGSACGVCAPAPRPGDSCAETQCPPSLVCLGSPPRCVAYAQAGAACGASQPCNDGLTCVGASATAAGVCQASVQSVDLPCSFSGAGCDFSAGLACNAQSGKCAVARLAQPGQACGIVANQLASCVSGTCPRGMCVANVPLGGACDLDGGPPCIGATRCILSVDGGAGGTCQLNGASTCP